MIEFLKSLVWKEQPNKVEVPEQKEVGTSPEFREYWMEISGTPLAGVKGDYRSLAREGYMKNSAAYAAIEEMATAVAGIKWMIVRNKNTDNVEMVVPDLNHKLNKVLTRPNPGESWELFIKKVTATWLIGGEIYVHRTRPLLELRNLRPDQMEPMKNGLGEIVQWKQTFDSGATRFYPVDDVRHVKDFHPLDDAKGFSRLQSAAIEIDITNAGGEWNHSLLRNGARPSGILKTPNNLDEEQFQRLRQERHELDQGTKNAGGLMITEGGIEFQEMGMNSKDMDFHNGIKAYRRHIWSVLNTPPELVGDSEAKTYSNYREARQAFYKENVLPFMDLLSAELNLWITFDDNVSFAYSTDDVESLQPDVDNLHDRNRKDVESGLITVNEARENLGMEKSTDAKADKLRDPSAKEPEEVKPGAKPTDGPRTGKDNGNAK
jgi:HK97 family phage portal protein